MPKGSYTPAFEINRVHLDDQRGDAPRAMTLRPRRPHVLESPRDGAAQRCERGRLAQVVDRRRRGRARSAQWPGSSTGLRGGGRSEPAIRLLTVTSFPGAEEDPSLSPDGNFVAFSWQGPAGVHSYIWVKAVDGDGLRRLTDTTDVSEKYPGVVTRRPLYRLLTSRRTDHSSVLVVSALGGPEQLIAEQGNNPTWLPDSRSLVMTSGVPRWPLRPRPAGPGDWRAAGR